MVYQPDIPENQVYSGGIKKIPHTGDANSVDRCGKYHHCHEEKENLMTVQFFGGEGIKKKLVGGYDYFSSSSFFFLYFWQPPKKFERVQ